MHNKTWQLSYELELIVQPIDPDESLDVSRGNLMEFVQKLDLASTSEQSIMASIIAACKNAAKHAIVIETDLRVIIRLYIRKKRAERSLRGDEQGSALSSFKQELNSLAAEPNLSLIGNLPQESDKAGGGYFLLERYVDSHDQQGETPYYLIELYFYYVRERPGEEGSI